MLVLNRMIPSLANVNNEMNHLLHAFFMDRPADVCNGKTPVAPPMNIWEDRHGYFIEAEVPGYSMDNIDVIVQKDELTIKGEHKMESSNKDTDGAFLRRERRTGSFVRSWTLPAEVDAEGVQASLKNGVLLVSLPKTQKDLPRKIQVKVAGS